MAVARDARPGKGSHLDKCRLRFERERKFECTRLSGPPTTTTAPATTSAPTSVLATTMSHQTLDVPTSVTDVPMHAAGTQSGGFTRPIEADIARWKLVWVMDFTTWGCWRLTSSLTVGGRRVFVNGSGLDTESQTVVLCPISEDVGGRGAGGGLRKRDDPCLLSAGCAIARLASRFPARGRWQVARPKKRR